ncbi:MAG: UvrD-helicase domain-containing protein, partial [bacterium]
GKTELLIQRVLVLLTQVEQPEEVVAITFTRKAAAEMRGRIVAALAAVERPIPPAEPHARLTWRLARAVRRRDAARGWALLRNPNRIRSYTIDALCSDLTRRLPLLSRLGSPPGILEDSRELYAEAARAVLEELERGGPAAAPAGRLLLHLENDPAKAEELLMRMLGKRDQWLRHLPSGGDPAALREILEAALRRVVLDGLAAVWAEFPPASLGELNELLAFAAANLTQDGKDSRIRDAAERPLAAKAGAEGEDLEAAFAAWLGARDLLLTGTGDWRKAIGKTVGFPTSKSAANGAEQTRRADMKARVERLRDTLQKREPLRAALAALDTLPYLRYPDGQWAVLEALLLLLPLAVRRLESAFAARGAVDFAEVNRAAAAALDHPRGALAHEPIRHLLVDEFQDTSFGQYQLIERLVADWEEGDGRTLFLVGDPMQSIYRFREAEVGLFLRARQRGIGRLRPRDLRLSVNFRSCRNLVEWFNGTFREILPPAESIETGAVPFSPSAPAPNAEAGQSAEFHPHCGRDDGAEAERIVQLVRAAPPEERVAILVRARTHLPKILAALRGAGIAYRATEIDSLAERPAVQDLLALTRALLHPADRIAWLAVLRAPWCGLRLEDLLRLVGDAPRLPLWELIPQRAAALEPAAAERLERVRAVLAGAIAERGRHPLRRWIEETWIALGGPACVDEAGLQDAQAFLTLLDGIDAEGEPPNPQAIAEAAEGLYAPPDPEAGTAVQVMTIHKAKGLEFDTVILPGLGRQPKSDDPEILRWRERPDPEGEGGNLVLAPIGGPGQRDRCYDHLQALEREQALHETGRLLYVAATRARRRLHLLGHGNPNPKTGEILPRRRTFLERLWAAAAEAFAGVPGPLSSDKAGPDDLPGAPAAIRRLPDGWAAPEPPSPVRAAGADSGAPSTVEEEDEDAAPLPYLWATQTARHVGTVVHQSLQRMAEAGGEPLHRDWVEGRRLYHRAELRGLGVSREELEGALQRVQRALLNTLADERGRWVVSSHEEAESELALTAWLDGVNRRVVLDRTFVDETGTRWIVDYKSGEHEGSDLEDFLDKQQERYRPQLERYARIMAKRDPRPIRLGLYFPLLQAWRDWAPGETG